MSRWQVQDGAACPHAEGLPAAAGPAEACEDCLRTGGRWVHLRRCLTCDHVGCCDSSPNRHATAHSGASGHPIMRSVEPGEDWRWCFLDQALV